ncbi:MAG: MotA/TolQ/ExbB proton channel family protein [Elusimicrobia bacterium]|nr:MotA/TolQ/ExbB proton channel family protein [Elusimicrobiota bacterium]
MFEGKTVWQIFAMGGFSMYILLLCSVVSVGVALERLLSYRAKSRIAVRTFMDMITENVERGDSKKAIAYCETSYTPITAVVRAGLKKNGHDEKEITSAMEREIMIETVKLEHYTTIIGTIGNIAVYIGLFGTVIGIIKSFHNISVLGSGGITVVIGGVAEALITTASGLFVAIPAVVAYNYFIRRVDTFVTEMEYCASQTLDLLISQRK